MFKCSSSVTRKDVRNDQERKEHLHRSTPIDTVCLNKMLAKTMLCDVTLVVGTREISAHKLILAASSTFFYWKFTNDRKLGLIKRIELKDISYETLSSIINYMYKAEILITAINVQDLLAASYMFALKDLQNACRDFLQSNLTVSNCLRTELIARQTHYEEMILTAGNYIDANFDEIIGDDKYLDLTFVNFLHMISRESLCAKEEDILECIFKWINFDIKNRKDYVYTLMKYVRFQLIPEKYILQRFEEEKWLKTDPQYYQFLVDILKSHILDKPQVLHLSHRTPSKLLVVVGITNETEMSLEMYDYQKKLWLRWPETLHIPCGFHPRMAICGSKVYCLQNRKLISMDITDPSKFKLTVHAWLSEYKIFVSLAAYNNNIYAVGGYDKDDGEHFASAEMFDTTSRKWKTIASMTEAKRSVSLCTFNGALFAVGGRTKIAATDSVECYRSDSNTWYKLPKMSFKRSGAGVASLGNKLFVVGGMTGNIFSKCVEVFDTDTCSWTRLPNMEVARSGPGVIAINDQIYVIGGYNDNGDLRTIEVYNPATNKWSMLPNSMLTAKRFVAVDLIERSKIML